MTMTPRQVEILNRLERVLSARLEPDHSPVLSRQPRAETKAEEDRKAKQRLR